MKEASANADEVTELDLGAKNIKRLPAGLRKLTKLRKLDLAGNPSLTQFPTWVAELEELTELKWSGPSLPEQVSLLPGLRRLELQGELGELPAVLQQLPKLESLSLLFFTLDELPEWLAELKISELVVGYWKGRTELPAVISRIATLRRLGLISMPLRELPEWLKDLKLDSLRLGDLPLRALPEWLFEKDLRELALQDLDHLDIPGDIAKLASLKHLNISPKVFRAGEELALEPISKLTGLEELHLANIEFESPPAWLAQLKELRRLYLPATKFTEPPRVLAELPKLEWVSLRYAPKLKGREAEVRALVPRAELIMPT